MVAFVLGALSCSPNREEQATPDPASKPDVAESPDVESIEERLAFLGFEVQKTRDFLASIQEAVSNGAPAMLAALVEFPLSANLDGKKVQIAGPGSFAEHYEQIVTESVRQAVLTQEFSELFANWQGVMIGKGEVWFSGVCRNEDCSDYEVRIIAIGPAGLDTRRNEISNVPGSRQDAER